MDRTHKEETIFKNPAENQQRNKENNILEVLGQSLRKQKNLQKTKNIIFQNSFLSHPEFQDLEKKPKKNKRTKKNNISELFLETPQIPRPGKKPKQPKKTIFQNSFLRHPKFQDLWKIVFFVFFVFFGFLQVFVKRLEILLFFFVFFGFLQGFWFSS